MIKHEPEYIKIKEDKEKDNEDKSQENNQNIEMLDYEEEQEEEEYEEEAAPVRGILYEHPKGKHAYIVVFLVALCIFLSLSFWFSPTYGNLLWTSKDAVFRQHEYWRLFTALFTHSDIKHLLSNMPLFVVFGWLLRSYFGLLAFPFAALVVGALANYASIYFYPDHMRLIGASGVVYGLVGLWVTFYLRYEIRYSLAMKIFGF